MARYLVTGGAGFIGSNLAEALVKAGHAVIVLDNFSTGKRQNIQHLEKQIELIEGDITVFDDVEKAVKGVEVIFHLAAVPSVPKSIQDPIGSNRAAIDGTLHVLVAARDAGVRRVVYASSSSVYGDQAPESPKIETMTPQPISPYGVAKLAAENYCQVFYRVYGLETVSLRYFNVFGQRQDPESLYAAVIPCFITAFLSGKPPVIYGDGEQTRDFTYVGNVVAGNLLAATAPAERVAGHVLNLAAGGRTSLNELVDMLQEITGITCEPIYEDARPGDIRHSMASVTKAKQLMGYEPSISVLTGLHDTVEWYRQQASS